MGWGDELMATGEARMLKQKYPNHKILIHNGPSKEMKFRREEMFRNNPYWTPFENLQEGDKYKVIKNQPKDRGYNVLSRSSANRLHFQKFTPIPGDIFFDSEEIAFAKRELGDLINEPFVFINPAVRGKISDNNKQWGFEKYQKIVNNNPNINFVQCEDGLKYTKWLDGVKRIVTYTYRLSCSVMSHATCYISNEGGMVHGGAAVGIPGVVLYGHYTNPKSLGYKNNINFAVDDPEYPYGCGTIHETCDRCTEAMANISIEKVEKSLLEMYNKLIKQPEEK